MASITNRPLSRSNALWKSLQKSTFSTSSFRRITHMTAYKPLHSVRTLSSRHCSTSNDDPRTRDYFNNYRHTHAPIVNTEFDPSNTEQVFQSMSTFQLLKYNAMFSLLSVEALTNLMIKIMSNAVGSGTPKEVDSTPPPSSPMTSGSMHYSDLSKLPGFDAVTAILGILGNIASKPLIYLVRKQYFPLFTGGESIEQCIAIAQKYYENNIGLIIDNSTEEGHTPDVYANNMAAKKNLVDVSHDKLKKSVVFMALKMTALCPSQLLEEMTHILNTEGPLDRDPTPFMSEEQMKSLEETIDTLIDVCQYAKDRGIGVWLDAEQYSRQPAMNFVSRRLMQHLNCDGKIYLYNTYQCYLKDSLDWISFDVQHAKQHGYACGVKLVRGAYFDYERKVAAMEGHASPVRDSKNDTDKAYNAAVDYVLGQIVESYGNVGIAVCTHNRASLENAIADMDKYGIPRDDKYVMTAQLNGMVDNLTYSLGYSGYNALKLMPYGDFEDVWPYLMRRLEENSSILNGSQQERACYVAELKRRMKALVGL